MKGEENNILLSSSTSMVSETQQVNSSNPIISSLVRFSHKIDEFLKSLKKNDSSTSEQPN